MKPCTKCGNTKDLTEFSDCKRAPDGKNWQCRQCDADGRADRLARSKHRCACGQGIDPRSTMCIKCLGLAQRGENSPSWRGGRSLTTEGYVELSGYYDHPNASQDGRILEHRLRMTEVLGRGLYPGENVHHINGNKEDNRPENLELWVSTQPAGQRVEDLRAWALAILERYGTE